MRISDWSSDVCSSDLDAARQQVAEVAELAQRIGEARAQAVDVGAVLRGRDQVDVAFLYQVALGHPGHRPVDDFGVLLLRADEQLRRQQFAVDQLAAQVVAQAVLVAPLVLLAAGIVQQAHRSEEHTSELQSLMRISYAVFCLKKKTHIK